MDMVDEKAGCDFDEQGVAQSVKFIVCQLLEDEHFRQIHQVMSQQWGRLSSLSAAMKLMEHYGVVLRQEEIDRLLTMDEVTQINALVMKMPQQSNEQFQHFFLQLQLIVSTATRIRMSLEDGNTEEVETVLGDAASAGILPYILRMAIVQAGTEVTTLKKQYKAWSDDADAKMSKLIRGQEDAMNAQRKLASAQQQLGTFLQAESEKTKGFLMAFVGANTEAIRVSVFKGWSNHAKAMRTENEIRKEFEEQIESSSRKLVQFKAEQSRGVRGMMEKKGESKEHDVKDDAFKLWKEVVEYDRDVRNNAGQVDELNAKIKSMQTSQAENTKKVIARMNGNNDMTLKSLGFQAWSQFLVEYRKNKEMEDTVKEAERAVNKFMQEKKENAKKLLANMTGGTDSGLIKNSFDGWMGVYLEAKAEAEMADMINGAQGKMKAFGDRSKNNAKSVMNRARIHQENMLNLKVFNAWRLDSRIERTLRLYAGRIDAKRQQLVGVQQMFRNFANQLEASLKEGSDSFRDLRDRPAQSKKTMSKSDATVSLPDINVKRSGRSGHS